MNFQNELMARIDQFSDDESKYGGLASSKEFRDYIDRQQAEKEKQESKRQQEIDRLEDIIERSVDRALANQNNLNERYQRYRERKEDRKFLWKVTLWSAIIGGAVASAITIILECFLK